jgi:hypothetical protein
MPWQSVEAGINIIDRVVPSIKDFSLQSGQSVKNPMKFYNKKKEV